MTAPTREEYEKAVDQIHIEIGRAVTEWSLVEERLFEIYARLVTPRGAISVGLSTSFNEVKSFDTRLAMVTRLVEHSGAPVDYRTKQTEHWKKTAKKAKSLAAKRNRLVHGSIISPEVVLDGPPVELPVWVPFYDAPAYKLHKLGGSVFGAREFEEWTDVDITKIRVSFIEAQKALAEFYDVYFGNRRL